MSKAACAIFGAITYILTFGHVWADTVALALRAPLQEGRVPLPALPALQPVSFEMSSPSVSMSSPTGVTGAVADQADISAFGFPCETELNAFALTDAMIEVTVSAPCKPRERIAFSLDDLTFDTALSMTGAARLTVPALSGSTHLVVTFEDNAQLRADVRAPNIAAFKRLAVEWANEPPQLSSKAPRYLPVDHTTLGDGTGRVVQIASHHIDPDARPGVIRLSMIRNVSQENCAQKGNGSVVLISSGILEQRYDLSLAAPGCDMVGRTIELKNILQDMKLAAN